MPCPTPEVNHSRIEQWPWQERFLTAFKSLDQVDLKYQLCSGEWRNVILHEKSSWTTASTILTGRNEYLVLNFKAVKVQVNLLGE